MADLALTTLFLPDPFIANISSFASHLMDEDTDKVAMVFQAPKAGNIRKISFRTATVNTGDTVKVSLQALDSSGNPDGTILGVGNSAYATQAIADANDNASFTVTLTADLAVTQGQILAAVVTFNSYVAGSINIAASAQNPVGFPYIDHYNKTGAAWTKTGRQVILGVEYDNGSYGYIPGCIPLSTTGTTSVDQDLDPHEFGNWFQVPIKMRAIGIWLRIAAAAVTSFDLKLYGDTTVTFTPDMDTMVESSMNCVLFTSPVVLNPDTDYYVTMHSVSSTAITLRYNDVINAAAMAQLPMGDKCYSVAKSNAGVWTATNTRRYQIGVIADQITTSPLTNVVGVSVQ